MKSKNNYINEAIKNPRYSIIYNGKEVRKFPFLRQAIGFKKKHDEPLFNSYVEILDTFTGESIS